MSKQAMRNLLDKWIAALKAKAVAYVAVDEYGNWFPFSLAQTEDECAARVVASTSLSCWDEADKHGVSILKITSTDTFVPIALEAREGATLEYVRGWKAEGK